MFGMLAPCSRRRIGSSRKHKSKWPKLLLELRIQTVIKKTRMVPRILDGTTIMMNGYLYIARGSPSTRPTQATTCATSRRTIRILTLWPLHPLMLDLATLTTSMITRPLISMGSVYMRSNVSSAAQTS